ncbi:PP2C family protein-serine/threonine phosphatase [Tessaracoccus sp. Z1128]
MDAHPQHSARAHYVREPAHWVGGASDTGRRHATNQDAMAMAVRPEPPPSAVLAVADGVSTARGSERASLVAVDTVVAALIDPPGVAVEEAFARANRAILEGREDPSACTLITATIESGLVTVANVGDSRAYWLGDDGEARLLSTDDSMAQARMLLGMTRDEAERSRQAHALTKWLGRQSTDVTPSVTSHRPAGAGWLLLCTDGLWNYASAPEVLHGVVAALSPTCAGPGALAEALTVWANEQGGKDNVTVIVARLHG